MRVNFPSSPPRWKFNIHSAKHTHTHSLSFSLHLARSATFDVYSLLWIQIFLACWHIYFKIHVAIGGREMWWVTKRNGREKRKLHGFGYTVYITVIKSNLVISYCLMCARQAFIVFQPNDFSAFLIFNKWICLAFAASATAAAATAAKPEPKK